MTTFVPAKAGAQFITYIALVDQSDTRKFKSNPTLAAGDFKVTIDGGAQANLATLPTVTPASSVFVKVTLGTGESTGANNTVAAIDAAGAEWCDQLVNVPTTARQVDDLSFPATSGRGTGVNSTGQVGVDFSNINLPVGLVAALGIVDNGVSTAVSSTSLALRTGRSYATNALYGRSLWFEDGTPEGQVVTINGNTNATPTVVSFDAPLITPTGTPSYAILAQALGSSTNPPNVVLTTAGAKAAADALLARNQKGGSDGPAGQQVADALAGGLMSLTIVAGVLTVKNGDGTTAYTRTLTRAALLAIASST